MDWNGPQGSDTRARVTLRGYCPVHLVSFSIELREVSPQLWEVPSTPSVAASGCLCPRTPPPPKPVITNSPIFPSWVSNQANWLPSTSPMFEWANSAWKQLE